jgi:hypothetical protein
VRSEWKERDMITAIDDAIPRRVIGELRAEIIDADARRDGRTHWYAFGEPRNVFEQVIGALRRFVRAKEIVGAEWWFRSGAADMDFPFHFDRDEGIRDRIVSPEVASILYLSGVGGPTVVLDATPTRKAAPREGVAIDPRPGWFAMFPGERLHGVLPRRAERWPRVTMLVNWWSEVPRMERARALVGARRVKAWRDDEGHPVALRRLDPARLHSAPAWREIVASQATYR